MHPLSAGGRLADRGGCGRGAEITLNQMKINPIICRGEHCSPDEINKNGFETGDY